MNQVMRRVRNALDGLYEQYNRRQFVHPDPLEFLYGYDCPADREIVALLAASLAYGRVAQILCSVRRLLECLEGRPRHFLERARPAELADTFASFKHRWTTGREVADLLAGVRRILDRYDSLRKAFSANLQPGQEDVQHALEGFLRQLQAGSDLPRTSLLPALHAGGACKRMHLFLRWMVRRDEVDPGGWDEISPAQLIVPLDTHMHRLGQALGFTRRQQGDLKTARQITVGFRAICPEDPVRYDFALTRFGIRSELDEHTFLNHCKGLGGSTCGHARRAKPAL